MNSMPFSIRLLALLLFIGLIGAGCDSGGSGGTTGGIIAPVKPQLDFGSIQPDSSRSDTLMLEYRGLSKHPRVDTASLPDVYTVEKLDETASPDNGSSSFRITFSGSRPGDYTSPIRFRASGVTGTVQFSGIVIGPQTISDFENGTAGFFAFGGPGISQEDGQLRIDGASLGGVGNFPGIVKPFSAPVNFEDTPVIEMRIRVTSSSEGPAVIRAALNGAGENPDANATVPDLVAEVPANGEYATYYFTFRDNFVQFNGAPVDPTKIGEFVLLFNDDMPETFTGTIFVDEIIRRPAIPENDG